MLLDLLLECRILNKLLSLALLISWAPLLAVGCGSGDNGSEPKSTPTAISVALDLSKDDLGRSVTLPQNPKRIVAMSPSVVELMLSVGVAPVGRPSSADYPESARSIAAFGDSYAPNFEEIVKMQPDLIIADAIIQAAIIGELAKLNAPVFALRVSSVDEVVRGFRVVGALTGAREAGEREATKLSGRLSQIQTKASAQGPSVLVLVGAGPGQFIAARNNSYIGSILGALKARNVVSSEPENFRFPGFTDYSPERILEKNPEIILTFSIGGRPGTPRTAEALKNDPALGNLTAVKQGKVFELDPVIYIQSAGPRLSLIFDELPRILYPSSFSSAR